MFNWLKRFSSETWQSKQMEGGTIYTGVFIVRNYGGRGRITIAGRIIERWGIPAAVYLRDPPQEVWNHRHRRCLQLVEPGSVWYKLHWEKPAYDFDTARYYVESLLVEALQTAS